jgi:MFS family permease
MLCAVGGVRRQLAESAAAFGAVFANANLRRLQLAWAASNIGRWAYAVAVAVYAYEADGAKAVGFLWLILMIPAAFASPFVAILADRFRRESVMLASDLIRVALFAGGAVCIWLDGPSAVIYAIAGVGSIVGAPFRSAQAALIPSLAQTPSELTAANVVSSSIESVGFFAGPALAGVLLGFASPATVFCVTAALVLLSAFFIARVHAPRAERSVEAAERAGVLSEALVGFRTLGRDPQLRVLVGLLAATTLVVGALEVLTVVSAIELLDLGQSGVGWLNTAFGVGALLGAVAAAALVGVRRLSVPFVVGVLLWGLPVALIGVTADPAAAVVFLGLVGVGNTLVDVAGFTLIQRAVPDEVLARVFGVIQFIWFGTIGVGAAVTPALIDWLGVRGTLIAVGCFAPVLLALFGPRLLAIDAAAEAPDAEELRLLRGVPIFAPLPGAALEHLAGRLMQLKYGAGTEVIRQGDPGDRFYLVGEGEVDVTADGRPLAVLGAGDYFGEIALLRDVPRTATVTTRAPVVLYALEREDFLAAVTGHPPSRRAAETVVASRLTAVPAAGEPVPGI